MNAGGKRPVAVLISGRGSNMIALADACAEPAFPARIVGVVSDRAEATGLALAAARGIETAAITRADHGSKSAHEAAIGRQLAQWDTQIVCLAGYMRLLSADFVNARAGRIINIHPSLLPRHKGLDTHARVLAAGDSKHGCTVHHVTAGMDDGPVIAQAALDVRADDTEQSLALRVLDEEHALYPRALRMVIESL